MLGVTDKYTFHTLYLQVEIIEIRIALLALVTLELKKISS